MDKIDYDKIAAALSGQIETTELTWEEMQIWSREFAALMDQPSPDEEAFWAQRRAKSEAPQVEQSKKSQDQDGQDPS